MSPQEPRQINTPIALFEQALQAATQAPTEQVTTAGFTTAEAWQLAEQLIAAADPGQRRAALARLTEDETSSHSPLVCFLLVGLLNDPDLALRAASARALSDLFARSDYHFFAPVEVRHFTAQLLRRFDSSQIVNLLLLLGEGETEAAHLQPEVLARLLDRTPNISTHLTHIAADRHQDGNVRVAAIRMTGELGLLDARAPLEGLRDRIKGRQAGQIGMRFAPPVASESERLIQALDEAIQWLENV